jgi:hypothetical protein
MHLLSLRSATVLSLMAFTHLVVGRALQRSNPNQANFYADQFCAQYTGTWPGPDIDGSGDATYSIAPRGESIWIGSILMFSGGTFDSFDFDGKDACIKYGAMGVHAGAHSWVDTQNNICFPINMNASSVSLYDSSVCGF